MHPRYPETPLTGPALSLILRSLQALLDSHDPFPGVVIDRGWNVRLTNRAARRLVSGIPENVRGVPTNIFRTALHPAGLAPRTRNFPQWSAYLLSRLDRAVARAQDPALTALADEIATWPAIPPRHTWSHRYRNDADNPVLSWRVDIDGAELSMFTILSSFGTPMDVTLSELSIELFFPTNEITESTLRRHTRTDAGSSAPLSTTTTQPTPDNFQEMLSAASQRPARTGPRRSGDRSRRRRHLE